MHRTCLGPSGRLLALVACGLLPDARAMPPEVELHLHSHAARYRAEERQPDGSLFNRDEGTLRGGGLGLTLQQAGTRWRLEASRSHGNLGYQGFTQLGLPLTTRTDMLVQRVSLDAQVLDTLLPWGVQASVQAGVGLLHLRRAIAPTAFSLPVIERLHQTSARLSFGLQAPWRGRWQAGLEGGASWPLEQRLGLDTLGTLDKLRLEPAARASGWLAATLRYQAAADLRIELGLHAEAWRFGDAPAKLATRNGRPAAVVSYPGSRQRMQALQLGLRWAWR